MRRILKETEKRNTYPEIRMRLLNYVYTIEYYSFFKLPSNDELKKAERNQEKALNKMMHLRPRSMPSDLTKAIKLARLKLKSEYPKPKTKPAGKIRIGSGGVI